MPCFKYNISVSVKSYVIARVSAMAVITSYVYLLIHSLGNYLSNLATIQQYGFGFNPCSARCSATDLGEALGTRISARVQLMHQAAPVVRPEVLERVRPFSCKRFQVPLWFPHCIESKIAAYSVVLNCT